MSRRSTFFGLARQPTGPCTPTGFARGGPAVGWATAGRKLSPRTQPDNRTTPIIFKKEPIPAPFFPPRRRLLYLRQLIPGKPKNNEKPSSKLRLRPPPSRQASILARAVPTPVAP